MKLIHYSPEPLGRLISKQQWSEILPHTKPRGLWVSVEGEDDWLEWCKENNFNLNRLAHVHDVTLAARARVAILNSAADIDAFTREFGERYYSSMAIRWRDVAKRWHGLIIAPYIWERRYSNGWYYGWDCASGCIWNRRAIASVTLRVSEPECGGSGMVGAPAAER